MKVPPLHHCGYIHKRGELCPGSNVPTTPEKEFSGMLWIIYKAWCREREIDPTDNANMKLFLDQALP